MAGKNAIVDPYNGEHAESIYAIWHDPTTYDHLRMGPPYLPDADTSKAVGVPRQANAIPDSDALREVRDLITREAANEDVENTLAHFLLDYGQTSYAELAALLVFLRASNMVHQAHHWQTLGPQFYGDHLMYERIYNDSLKIVDSLAERLVGLSNGNLVNPVVQSAHQAAIIKSLYNLMPMDGNPEQLALVSLKAVIKTAVLLKFVYGILEKKRMLTHGTDNLLQGISDKCEEFVYLLKQRTGGRMLQAKTASDVAWKATP